MLLCVKGAMGTTVRYPAWLAIICLCLLCPALPASAQRAGSPTPRIASGSPAGVACQGGVFEIPLETELPPTHGPLRGSAGGFTLELLNGQIAILDVAPPVDAHLRLTARGTEIRARWPAGEGLPDGALMDAVIEKETCSVMAGTFQVGGGPPRPFGARSRLLSGEGTVGGGEGGDPDEGNSDNAGGHKGFQRWYWQFSQAANPGGLIPPDALENGYGQTLLAPVAPGRWVSLGPAPVRDKPGDPTESPRSINSGRVSALAVDPWDSGHWLIGATTGGVWETRDVGATWAPRTDDQPSLAISALAFAPSAPNVAYAGTGLYSPLGGSPYPGVGILKSIDGGTTWGRFGVSVFTGLGFGGIAVSPVTPSDLVVATVLDVPLEFLEAHLPSGGGAPGVYRSSTGGSTWELKLPGQATAVASHPTTPFFFLYAGLGKAAAPKPTQGPVFQKIAPKKIGVFRSLDGGKTWNAIQGPWTTRPGGIGEVRLALSPSNPDVLYVSIRDAKDGTGKDGYLLGVWRTGNAWDPTPAWNELPAPNLVPYGGHDLLVHGLDADIVYLASGGPPLWKYVGDQWLTIAQSVPTDPQSSDVIHVDHRALAWVPPEHLLVGNDGGIYLKNEGADGPWLPRNEGLATIQFAAGAVHPDDPTVVLGGAIDNGVNLMVPPAGKTWKHVASGDGMGGFFGAVPQHFAFFMQYGGVQRSLDGGATFFNAIFGIPESEQISGWKTVTARCPAHANAVLYGAARVWKSTNFFVPSDFHDITWASKSDSGATVAALAFAPSDSSCGTYAVARTNGKVFLTMDDGAHWSPLNPGAELPERKITSLAFSPAGAGVLWVAFSGYEAVTPAQPGHLFRTDDATSASPTWHNVSPPVDLPHRVVTVHPTSPGTVLVGTDLGAWVTNDTGATWHHIGPSIGMPNVPVMDIHIGPCHATAFTYGRGAFRSVSLVPCGS
jgi:photosystem II stability/assembly factor-like uncharacterized protein